MSDRDIEVASLPNLEVLELKVMQLLEKIRGLREENGDLRTELKHLRDELDSAHGRESVLKHELEEARKDRRDPERDQEIKRKISGLLTKLNGIQQEV